MACHVISNETAFEGLKNLDMQELASYLDTRRWAHDNVAVLRALLQADKLSERKRKVFSRYMLKNSALAIAYAARHYKSLMAEKEMEHEMTEEEMTEEELEEEMTEEEMTEEEMTEEEMTEEEMTEEEMRDEKAVEFVKMAVGH
jgi:hypothetical protein